MKRAVLLYLLLVSSGMAAFATYTVQLKDGRVITADEKILVKDDMAYFTRRGVYFYLPASQIDVPATDRLNAAAIADTVLETAPVVAPNAAGVKPMVIGEEQLEVIRNRSRLANEGQFSAPAGATGQPGVPASAQQATQNQGADRNALQFHLNDLLQQQAVFQQDQTKLQDQLTSLQDEWNQSPLQNDRDRMQSQIDAVSSQLQAAQGRLDSVRSDVQATQQQMNSSTIVVDMGNQESAAPPAAPTNPPPEGE